MKLVTRTMFWLMSIPVLLVGSAAISWGVVVMLDSAFGGTRFDVWGDMEGMVLPYWVITAVLFVVGFVVLVWSMLRWSNRDRDA